MRLARDDTDSLTLRLASAIKGVPAGALLYVYIAGHGDRRGVRSGPRSWITPGGLRAALAAGSFAHALIAVESCDAGAFGRAASARIAVLTAARSDENAYASRYDARSGEWLGDEFSDALAGVVRAGGSPTLEQAYRRVTARVWNAHPQLFGDTAGLRLGAFFGR